MVKKFLILILGLIAVSFITAKTVSAAITSSAHDFSAETWNTTGQICQVCHTPHSAGSAIAPLWNHAVSAASYTLYSSPSLTATLGTPSNSSKACLSCHDGTVALNSFGGNGTIASDVFLTDSHNLGTDLANDHPVSFTYDTALATADGSLSDPATKTVAALGGKTIDAGMLIGSKVECGSCHDVHAGKGDSATAGNLLLVNNSGSALCLTCHNK